MVLWDTSFSNGFTLGSLFVLMVALDFRNEGEIG